MNTYIFFLIFMSIFKLNLCQDKSLIVEDYSGQADDNSGRADDNSGQADDNSGLADDYSGQADDNSVQADDNSGQADNNSVQADDNSGQADDNSVQADDNSGQADDNSGPAEDNSGQAEDSGAVYEIPFDKAKVKYHRSRYCITAFKQEHCVFTEEEPGDPAKIAGLYKLWMQGYKQSKQNVNFKKIPHNSKPPRNGGELYDLDY